MFRFVLFSVMAGLLLAVSVNAQERKEIDVPELAIWESIRRGPMVQELGTIAAGEIDIIADALAPPEDDSHKWFITLVTQDKCQPCEALKAAFIQKEPLKAWVNVDDVAKSSTHYQVRRVEDSTQKDWMKSLEAEIQKGVFPLLVIQPPRNGEFGPNKTVVAVLHGFDGDCEKYSQRIRDAIVNYVREMSRRGLISHIGDNQRRAEKTNGTRGISGDEKEKAVKPKFTGGNTQEFSEPPPFPIPPNRVNPFAPSGAVDFQPQPQQAFTPEQIRMLIPNAPVEFVSHAMLQRVGDAQTLSLLWQGYNIESQAIAANSTRVGWLNMAELALTGGNAVGLLVFALTILKRVSTNPKIDATADKILQIVEGFQKG